jgi:flavin-dependent dehydrogenase
MRTPVAIVGSGPAGCAAALTLRRYLPEWPVVLVTMPATAVRAAPAVGETLSPGALPLLGYLGIREDFLRAGHLPAGGTASAWGSAQVFERNYLFSGRGSGWHLDRSSFDAWLLSHAEASGAVCVRARAARAARAEGRWSIELVGGGAIAAAAMVDATGRAACLARHQGSLLERDDALVATARWYVHEQFERAAEGALVESASDGWWYSATLPGQRAVAMFLTDTDLRTRTTWEDRLAVAPATHDRLATWRETGEAAVRAANSQRSQPVTGAGWVAAGDAALAFDPISSLGIGFSLRSGMEAARVAAAAAERDDGPAAAYVASIAQIYRNYRTRLRDIYQQEGRWPEEPFWARRRGCSERAT